MSGYDSNYDGIADSWAMDMEGDGYAETWAVDANQNGVIDTVMSDSNVDGYIDSYVIDSNENGYGEYVGVDYDQNGYIDAAIVDNNENGVADNAEVASENPLYSFQTTFGAPTYDGVGGVLNGLAAETGSFTSGSNDYDGDGVTDQYDARPDNKYWY